MLNSSDESFSMDLPTLVSKKAYGLINQLYSQYKGDMLARLDLVSDYLDESLFIIEQECRNPFSNEPREIHNVLTYARIVLIPKFYSRAFSIIEEGKKEPDPFKNRIWN